MSFTTRVFQGAALSLAMFSANAVEAASDPKGIWFDQDRRGAVEINDCTSGRGLCGYVVYVKEKKHADRCGMQILGHVTSSGGGWIYSPTRGRKYTVRLKRLSDSKLRVVGNATSSFFSKTLIWKKAPSDLQLCGKYAARNAAPAGQADVSVASKQPEERVETTRRVAKRDPLISEFVANPKPSRFGKTDRDTQAEEEAELEQNATGEKNETVDQKDSPNDEPASAEGEKEYGMVDDGANDDEAPVENDLTEMFDTLVEKANEFGSKAKRKCKFRIPYVDRVIMIPCND